MTALLSMGEDAEYTPEAVNAAIVGITKVESDILCKPWYYADLPLHIPNNWDITVVPDSGLGKMVPFEDCFEIAALDQPLIDTRAAEKEQGLGAFAD